MLFQTPSPDLPPVEQDSIIYQLPTSSPELAVQVDSTQVLSTLERVDELFQAAVALFCLDDCSY